MCEVEDNTWCVWLSFAQGNKQGDSFISLWEGAQLPMFTGVTILVFILACVAIFFMAKKGWLGK